ncbi:MAG: hypothetical protein COW12_02880 [Candidatus Omnitrophica bacterium CG12_big_fil_rev_8_21_14_0_65_45_16]|nr:MAG: hypothetical protein COW12_02880 [Candidatus Omnitrophica bacterium CG12_big_fil_rev_8_21_14_0_65_45_16]
MKVNLCEFKWSVQPLRYSFMGFDISMKHSFAGQSLSLIRKCIGSSRTALTFFIDIMICYYLMKVSADAQYLKFIEIRLMYYWKASGAVMTPLIE